MSKVGILGVGAIGSVVAAMLAQNSNLQLHFFNRSERTELKIDRPDGRFEMQINALTTPPQNLRLDCLIICLKAHQFDGAHPWLKALISKNTKVVVIRNGLHHTEPILQYSNAGSYSACLIDCPTQPQENGLLRQLSAPKFTLPQSQLTEAFVALFENSDAEFNLVSDFKTAAWKKVCESSALGGTLCYYRETCSVFKNQEAIALYKNLLSEAIEVALSDGAQIDKEFADETLAKVLQYPPEKGSSMLTDLLLGKELELDAKNGIICKIGITNKVHLIHNKKVVELLNNGS